jgi:hypothetical protein
LKLVHPHYHCRHCRSSDRNWQGALRLGDRRLTPAGEELVALAGLLSSFGEAADKTLRKLSGMRQQGERATKADCRMTYVGMIYNPSLVDDAKPIADRRYLAGLYLAGPCWRNWTGLIDRGGRKRCKKRGEKQPATSATMSTAWTILAIAPGVGGSAADRSKRPAKR